VKNAASVGPVDVSAHWTSKIGTGHASESNARIGSSLADARIRR
jgi:hypothetical protein